MSQAPDSERFRERRRELDCVIYLGGPQSLPISVHQKEIVFPSRGRGEWA